MNYTVDIENKEIIHEGLTEKQLKALQKVFGPKGYRFIDWGNQEMRSMALKRQFSNPVESYRFDILDMSNGHVYKPIDKETIKSVVTDMLTNFDKTGEL